jgi:hypothetical protein
MSSLDTASQISARTTTIWDADLLCSLSLLIARFTEFILRGQVYPEL